MDQVLGWFERRRANCHFGPVHARSESQLREAIRKCRNPTPRTTPEPVRGTKRTSTLLRRDQCGQGGLGLSDGRNTFQSPTIISGKCPICGMTLVPVTKSSARKKFSGRPGALLQPVPMPEHSDVHSDKPGKCPIVWHDAYSGDEPRRQQERQSVGAWERESVTTLERLRRPGNLERIRK